MAVPEIVLVQGDITQQTVDAIVNAANSSLMGGGGVDGAIHRRGGPAILEECRRLRETRYPDGLPPGDAVATTAGALPARWVIHTVGPIYSGSTDPANTLASCYLRSLEVADELDVRRVAFPAISTGAYGYPLDEAARVALETVSKAETSVVEARFVLFGEAAYQTFKRAAKELAVDVSLNTEMSDKIKVLIAEDHPLMREAITARLGLDEDIEIVGEAGDGQECIDMFAETNPDVTLVDVSMPGINGIDATKAIRSKNPDAKIIILSASSDRASISSALAAGAIGYLLKSVDGAQLNAYIHQASEGKAVFDAGSALRVIEGLQPRKSAVSIPSLSTREVEVLAALSEGNTYQEIAEQMSISLSSVRTYVKRLFDKLGVSDRAAAVRQGMRAGIIS